MKVIYFNIANTSYDPKGINNFISEHKRNSIFCFQENYDTALALTKKVLIDYKSFSASKFIDENSRFGNSIFFSNDLTVIKSSMGLVNDPNIGLCLAVTFKYKKKEFNILNFHGIAFPGNKLDTKNRIDQSTKILELTKNFGPATVIGGDFNLMPQTKSIKLIEKNNYRNLISEYNIKSTRNENSWKLYQESKQHFADYIFVTHDIKVNSLEVPYTEISDHLPMILEFEI